MKNYLKYLKGFIYILVPMLVLNFLISVLYYFNLFSSSVNNYLKLFIIAISMFIGGIYIGSKTDKKGWLEGIKLGLPIIFLIFIISYLGFDSFEAKDLLYYLILLVSTILGSILGINKRKN